MKLFIYGKMFHSLDTMTVTDENGKALYYAEVVGSMMFTAVGPH